LSSASTTVGIISWDIHRRTETNGDLAAQNGDFGVIERSNAGIFQQ